MPTAGGRLQAKPMGVRRLKPGDSRANQHTGRTENAGFRRRAGRRGKLDGCKRTTAAEMNQRNGVRMGWRPLTVYYCSSAMGDGSLTEILPN